jgi:Reverse transcriptase (RNA-dependent DNA polymerase)
VYPYLLKYFDEHMIAAKTRYILEIATLQVFFLAFADDAVLLSHNAEGLQHMLNIFTKFCSAKGLKINVSKTKVMQINMDVLFECDGLELKNVSEFKYLGLIINRAHNSPTSMLE